LLDIVDKGTVDPNVEEVGQLLTIEFDMRRGRLTIDDINIDKDVSRYIAGSKRL